MPTSPNSPQPAPVTGKDDVLPWVLNRLNEWGLRGAKLLAESLVERAEAGLKKYGTRLQTFNGRDAVIDAYQEAQDAVMYLSQKRMESDPAEDLQVRELLHLAEDLAVGLAYLINDRENKGG